MLSEDKHGGAHARSGSKQPAVLLFHPCGRGAADRTHRCLKRNLGAQLRWILEAKATAGCVQEDLWVAQCASVCGKEAVGGREWVFTGPLCSRKKKKKKYRDLVRDLELGRHGRWIGSPPLSAVPSASKLRGTTNRTMSSVSEGSETSGFAAWLRNRSPRLGQLLTAVYIHG